MTEPILVVDDQPELRLLIRMCLAPLGRVETAGSAAEARERIRGEPPRLIVLDVSLGADCGLELCRSLKADPATREIRILLLSAHVQDADMATGLAAGAARYMRKPFSPRELLETCAALLA